MYITQNIEIGSAWNITNFMFYICMYNWNGKLFQSIRKHTNC